MRQAQAFRIRSAHHDPPVKTVLRDKADHPMNYSTTFENIGSLPGQPTAVQAIRMAPPRGLSSR